MNPVAGLVLCGGRSRRMGTDKAMLGLNGRPMVVAIAERMKEVADPVLLAPGRVGRLGGLGYREVRDEAPDAGPLGGLLAGLAASPHELLAAVAVDMPFAHPAVFQLLVELHKGEDAIVPVTEDGAQPLHAVYARSALPAMRESLSRGDLALRSLVRSMDVRLVKETEWRRADPSGRFCANLNRERDRSLLP